MARFGISGIIEKRGANTRLLKKQRVRGQRVAVWNGNTTFNMKKEAARLISGQESVHDYVQRVYNEGTLVIIEAVGFISNDEPVLMKDLYPGHNEYFVCFAKYGYDMYLLTIGSKTVQEFRAAGHDTYLKSRVPLVLTIKTDEHGAKRFESVNLQPSIRRDETYFPLTQTRGETNGNESDQWDQDEERDG